MDNLKEGPVETSMSKKEPHHKAEESLSEMLDDITREHFPRHHHFSHKDVNHGQKNFMEGLSVYNLLWVFISASIIGVCSEMILTLLKEGKIVNRAGMLYGPFNQVYGFGAVLLAILLYKLRNHNMLIIILGSMMIGMAFEYSCSWIQEIFFGSTSWDYSHMHSSIGNRTNLLYGIGWGLAGYFYICHFWPWMTEMVGRIPNQIGKFITVTITVLLTLNLLLSAAAVWREKERAEGILATNAIERWLDKTYPNEIMAKKYPNMNLKKQN